MLFSSIVSFFSDASNYLDIIQNSVNKIKQKISLML